MRSTGRARLGGAPPARRRRRRQPDLCKASTSLRRIVNGARSAPGRCGKRRRSQSWWGAGGFIRPISRPFGFGYKRARTAPCSALRLGPQPCGSCHPLRTAARRLLPSSLAPSSEAARRRGEVGVGEDRRPEEASHLTTLSCPDPSWVSGRRPLVTAGGSPGCIGAICGHSMCLPWLPRQKACGLTFSPLVDDALLETVRFDLHTSCAKSTSRRRRPSKPTPDAASSRYSGAPPRASRRRGLRDAVADAPRAPERAGAQSSLPRPRGSSSRHHHPLRLVTGSSRWAAGRRVRAPAARARRERRRDVPRPSTAARHRPRRRRAAAAARGCASCSSLTRDATVAIDACAARLAADKSPLDGLVNNAGVASEVPPPSTRSASARASTAPTRSRCSA